MLKRKPDIAALPDFFNLKNNIQRLSGSFYSILLANTQSGSDGSGLRNTLYA
jgi:hypothetical protein